MLHFLGTIIIFVALLTDFFASRFFKMRPEPDSRPEEIVLAYPFARKAAAILVAALYLAYILIAFINSQGVFSLTTRVIFFAFMMVLILVYILMVLSLRFVLSNSAITRKTAFRTLSIRWDEVVEVKSNEGILEAWFQFVAPRAKLRISSYGAELTHVAKAIKKYGHPRSGVAPSLC